MLHPRTCLVAIALVVTTTWGAVAVLAGPSDIDGHVKRIDRHASDPFEQRQRETAIRALGRLGGKEAARALVPLLEDPYVHIHDHVRLAWIKMLQGARAQETLSWLLKSGLGHRKPAVRAAVAIVLGAAGGDGVAAALAKRVAIEKKPEVLTELARAATRLPADLELGRAAIARFHLKRRSETLLELATAAARHAGPEAVESLLALLDRREPGARAGAVGGLQALDALPIDRIDSVLADSDITPAITLAETLHLGTKAVPWPGRGVIVLERLLAHESWRVRAASIQAALRIWEVDAVGLLVDRLGEETGRLRDDVHRALVTLTGKSMAPDADIWSAWWRTAGEKLELGKRPDLDAGGRVPFVDTTEPDEHEAAGDDRTVAFFDLPLQSQRVAFLFDVSGSFRNAAFKQPGSPTKLELLRREFARTLAQLDASTHFDLLIYRYPSDHPPRPVLLRAFGKPAPATKQNVKKAEAWLAKQEAFGWGAFVEPVEALFAEDFDTLIFLSDGGPSRGRFDTAKRILQEFPALNRFAHLAVHTVLIGTKGADRKFMEGWAALTGGRFCAVVDDEGDG